MKKQYYSVDMIKIICALLIICIHTSPLSSLSGRLNSLLVNCICRIAVPFFFIASGFFLFSKSGVETSETGVIKAYLKRMLFLYLFWSAVYFPFTALNMAYPPIGETALSVFLNWLKNMVFSAGFGFLWYLPASIAAVSSVYSFIGTTRNGVFEGIVFIALGAELSQRAADGSLGSFKRNIFGFAVSSVLLAAEFVFVGKMKWHLEYDMYLFLIPAAYFLFRSALSFSEPPSFAGARLLRPYSSLIYFIHMLPIELYCIFTPLSYTNSVAMFFIALIPTLLLSSLIIYVSEKRRFEFLKKIY